MEPQIQLLLGIKEKSIPLILLTKSKISETGTITFIFEKIRTILAKKYFLNQQLCFYLLWENKQIHTEDVQLYFKKGKPSFIKVTLLVKNAKGWEEFYDFFVKYQVLIGHL